jgi:hypothetical protein
LSWLIGLFGSIELPKGTLTDINVLKVSDIIDTFVFLFCGVGVSLWKWCRVLAPKALGLVLLDGTPKEVSCTTRECPFVFLFEEYSCHFLAGSSLFELAPEV